MLWAIEAVERHVADTEIEAHLKRLKEIIRNAGAKGITKSEITRASQWLKSRDRNEILETLIESGALYQKGLVEQDEAARKAIFNQMEDLMESSGGFIFICFEPYIALHDSTLKPVILADGQPDPVMFTKA